MDGRPERSCNSLFDFGPLARDYDRWYETPNGRVHDHAQRRDVRRLVRSGRTGQRLLDVGCGTGHWSRFFAKMGYLVMGIDISPEMVRVAEAAAPECSFQVADAGRLPFSDGSFDLVASMATLEFTRDPEAVVQEMVRCAKPRGILVVGALNQLSPVNRRRLAEGKQPYASARLFSPGQLRLLLSSWGRVRMAASRPGTRWLGRCRPTLVADRSQAPRGKLGGPFIVAEVRL